MFDLEDTFEHLKDMVDIDPWNMKKSRGKGFELFGTSLSFISLILRFNS